MSHEGLTQLLTMIVIVLFLIVIACAFGKGGSMTAPRGSKASDREPERVYASHERMLTSDVSIR